VLLTSEKALQQVRAEGLVVRVSDNETGYFGVYLDKSCKPKRYKARVRRGGKKVSLGHFATAEEAALCVARTPEGKAAAERAAAAAPLPSQEALQQAHAEVLTLRVSNSKTGYFGVYLDNPGHPKPYRAQVSRNGKTVTLGSFATAKEAALCYARSVEAAEGATAAPQPLSEGEEDGASGDGQEALPPLERSSRRSSTVSGASRRSSGSSSSVTASGNPKRAAVRTSPSKARKAARRDKAGQAVTEQMSAEHEEEQMQELQAAGLAEEAAGQRLRQKGHRRGADRSTHTSRAYVQDEQAQALEAAAARNASIGVVALDVIYEAAGAATDELSAEVATEVMLMVIACEEGM